MNRSDGRMSMNSESASTPGARPTERMMTLRWGWTAASSADSSPSLTSLRTSVWSSVICWKCCPRKRYSRLSPTWETKACWPAAKNSTAVVAIPWHSGCSHAWRKIWSLLAVMVWGMACSR